MKKKKKNLFKRQESIINMNLKIDFSMFHNKFWLFNINFIGLVVEKKLIKNLYTKISKIKLNNF